MYAAVAQIVAVVSMLSAPFVHSDRAQAKTRPQIVENGSAVVTLPFPIDDRGGYVNAVTFGPDGTAYFVDAPNDVASVSPAGVYTRISVPRATGTSIVYARGNLWVAATSGVVRVDPNGSRLHWYSLYNAGPFAALEIALGPNDTIYVGGYNNSPSKGLIDSFATIDASGAVTTIPTPVFPMGFAFNKAGQLYFDYYGPSGEQGIARLEKDGSTTLLPWPYPQYRLNAFGSFVASVDGNIYFSAYVSPRSNPEGAGFLGRVSSAGVITQIALPYQDSSFVQGIATDFGGNLWLAFQSAHPTGFPELYQYDVYDGRYTGPYASAQLDQIYSGPFVGPDDNIWTVRLDTNLNHYYDPMALQVFVRKIQTLEPVSVSLAAGNSAPFDVLETHYDGPWTARSLDPSVATVSPASSVSGQFMVRKTKPGTTSIVVRDRLGNVSYELVTAQ